MSWSKCPSCRSLLLYTAGLPWICSILLLMFRRNILNYDNGWFYTRCRSCGYQGLALPFQRFMSRLAPQKPYHLVKAAPSAGCFSLLLYLKAGCSLCAVVQMQSLLCADKAERRSGKQVVIGVLPEAECSVETAPYSVLIRTPKKPSLSCGYPPLLLGDWNSIPLGSVLTQIIRNGFVWENLSEWSEPNVSAWRNIPEGSQEVGWRVPSKPG